MKKVAYKILRFIANTAINGMERLNKPARVNPHPYMSLEWMRWEEIWNE